MKRLGTIVLALTTALLAGPAGAGSSEGLDSPVGVTGGLRDFGVTEKTPEEVPEVVYFKAAPAPAPSPFRQRIAARKGLIPAEPLTLMGRLYTPEGEPPFAAVVLLHGSAGIGSWNEAWARRLRAWGYVVLDVDSLSPRGIYPYNNMGALGWEKPGSRLVTATLRAGDARGARAYLASLPFVDGDRIAALGASQGGATVMMALDVQEDASVSGRFQAGVALYPRCHEHRAFDAPLLVVNAGADQFVSASQCEDTIAAMSRSVRAELITYPGVHHGFDIDEPEQVVWGRILRHDPAAAADAIARIRAFVAEHLR